MPHISIKAEAIAHIAGFPITNSLLLSIIVLVVFFFLARFYSSQIEKKNKSAFFYVLHALIKTVYTMLESVLHDKINVFFPLAGAFFMFILLQNWFGLIPGVGSILVPVREPTAQVETVQVPVNQVGEQKLIATSEAKTNTESVPANPTEKTAHIIEMAPIFRAATADLNTTIALALIAVVMIQVYGIKYLGPLKYAKKFINISNPIDFVVGFLELISEFSKIISFSFRLFGNVFAGEVLLTILAFLIPVAVSFPFYLLEMFVGFIQAFVFAMLTAVFINLAITSHSEH